MTTITVDPHTGEVIAAATGTGGGELFDPAPYQSPMPTLDGHRADTLKLAFTGAVEIDKNLDDDVQWFQGLRFGQEIDLRITATVGKHGWTLKTTSDDGETVTHTLGLVIHSIDLTENV